MNRTEEQKRLIMIRIILLAFILFFNSTSTTYLYSFLPDMMVNFGLVPNKTTAGAYASWMASGFFFGRFASATFWGVFIDKHGRKTGLLIVLGTVSVLTLVFGFVTNFWMALFIRFITGVANGLSIVGKTLSTEICPDDMKPWSISVTNTIWALGMTVGPFIGSFFYNTIPGFPYLASALAVTILGIILMALSSHYFVETLDLSKVQGSKDKELKSTKNAFEEEKSIDEEDASQLEKKRLVNDFNHLSKSEQIKYIFRVPNITKLILIFGINTFYAAVIGELIPFWVAANYDDGGLGFQYKDISHIYLYLTGPQLVLQIFLYPLLQKGRGDFWLLTTGHLAHIPMFLLLPYAHWFGNKEFLEQKTWIIFWLFVRNVASFMNFSSLQRFTNDAIAADKRGKINGFQVTFSSLLQTAGPILGGWVLAWSMSNDMPYPFNYHFVFLLMVGITIFTLTVVYKLEFFDKNKTKLKGEEKAGL